MADTQMNRTDASKQSGQAVARRDAEQPSLQPWQRGGLGPFQFMDRMTEEMDRMFDRVFGDFGWPRRSLLSRGLFAPSTGEELWAPRIEAFQKGDRFIVRAELPGLKKDDVQVELTDEALTIQGERREEREKEGEGYYHSEREYGRFQRTIPLPDGVITESAQASFKEGILEISMQAPPAETRGRRRLEIQEATDTAHKK